MNNFPAITEAQRQELINLLINRHAIMAPDVDIKRMEQNMEIALDIALAALTAEPKLWSYWFNSELHYQESRFGRPKLKNGKEVHETFYTAPPVPVLRVPDGWIKCSERYPEVGQEVLIRIPVCEKFNIENGKYAGDGLFLGAWFDTRGKGRPYKVTHWMPLPSPPEDSNEQ